MKSNHEAMIATESNLMYISNLIIFSHPHPHTLVTHTLVTHIHTLVTHTHTLVTHTHT